MSEILGVLSSVIGDRSPTFADYVTNSRTRTTFRAEIETVQDIESNMLLGRDARESVIFHVADRTAAANIMMDDIITALGSRFQILRRTDNPNAPQVAFGAMKATENDD